eukprot:5211994-Pyramimonas_sp.AAC.1
MARAEDLAAAIFRHSVPKPDDAEFGYPRLRFLSERAMVRCILEVIRLGNVLHQSPPPVVCVCARLCVSVCARVCARVRGGRGGDGARKDVSDQR